MELRLPGSGTLRDLIGGAAWDLLTDPGDYVSTQRDTARRYDGVSPGEVAEAINLLGSGSLEYVGLIGDVAEIQAADVPGGYVIERSLGDEFVAHSRTLDVDELRAAFLAFLDGDVDAGLGDWPEAPPQPERKKRRLFGKR